MCASSMAICYWSKVCAYRNEVQMLLKRFRSKLGISVGEVLISTVDGSKYVLLLYAED